jgi:1,2-dihydroxy-3,5-cyclohexadiene-1,4-dicarboxylate dehydrogenase
MQADSLQPREPARLALAAGDPNGIGPEIALKALAALAALPEADRARITLYGPASVFERTASQLGLAALLRDVRLVSVGELPASAAVPGRIDAAAGASAVASATAALQACRRGEVDAVVACPHHETAIHQAGIAFSGYPSLVARVCGVSEDSVFLMLVGGGLRIVHATLHESVRTALDRLTPSLVMQACARARRPVRCWAWPTRRSACSASTRMRRRADCSGPKTRPSPCLPSRRCAPKACA